MFIQVVTGDVKDREGVLRNDKNWQHDVRPGAVGYLGRTAGITDDGRFIVMARFDSAEAARRNSDRPEQTAWFQEMEKCIDNVEFHDCPRVETLFGGGKDEAGFVQVMVQRVKDRAKFDELSARNREVEDAMRRNRPDVIGDVMAVADDGSLYEAIYFTSEAEARRNEAKEMPAEVQQLMQSWSDVVEVQGFIDLKQPLLA